MDTILEHIDGMAVRVAGDMARDAAERVLWIHGYTMDHTIWHELWTQLPGFTHLGLDLPGHGSSLPLQPEQNLGQLARRVAAVAEKMKVRHLAGLSFGATVALQVAIESPGLLNTLVLGAPGLSPGPVDPHAETRHQELKRSYNLRGPGPWMRDLWMTSPPEIFSGAARHPALWERLRQVVGRHSWQELGNNAMKHLVNYDQPLVALRRILASTLIIVGEDDMDCFKRCAELIRRPIPRCRRIYLAGAGHLCLLESAAEVAPVLQRHFLGTAD